MQEGQFTSCEKCGKQVKVLMVKKPGPNNGKLFVSCNPQYGGCGEFKFLGYTPPPPTYGGQKRPHTEMAQAPEPKLPDPETQFFREQLMTTLQEISIKLSALVDLFQARQ